MALTFGAEHGGGMDNVRTRMLGVRGQSAAARASVDATPSFEELARLVSSLHQAAAALRVAANSTACARDVVAAELPSAASTRAVA
jgi:hypothetical protein